MIMVDGKNVVIGYGAGAIADYPWNLDGSRPWVPEDEDKALKTLLATQECKVRTIDTANRYGAGESERLVGKFLSMLPEDKANEYFIITKIDMGPATQMYGRLKQSIERLGRKPAALLLHNPDFGRPDDVDAACEWLTEDVKRMGIGFVGISTEPYAGARYYYLRYRLNVIEFPYSISDRRAESEIFTWINRDQWVLKIANRVLGGPDRKVIPDAGFCLDFIARSKGNIDVALVGTTNPSHIIQAATLMRMLNGVYNGKGDTK